MTSDYSKIFTHLLPNQKILSIIPISGGGGNRKYFRLLLNGDLSVIGVVADDIRDAKSFVSLSKIFKKNNIPVPDIISHSQDFKYYIEEDLGDISLFSILQKNEPLPIDIIENVMYLLTKLQTVPRAEWVDSVVYPPFDKRLVMWDLNYFKYEYLKPANINFDENLLEDDFEKLSSSLLSVPNNLWGFQMRDCQSRNIMLAPEPTFIDYQGGRVGPCIYDAVSFLWQAKANFNNELRRKLLDFYADSYSKVKQMDKYDVLKYAGIFILFRTLQVLGAYGLRGLIQKKSHFIESIPFALNNLKDIIEVGILNDYPELMRICRILINDSRFNLATYDKLHVKVFSFSYKKGYPDDYTGNGGGFMFDCRGMHNPGRYQEYKHLTGLDNPVINFLKQKGESDIFVQNAFDLILPTIERYINRGFSSLQIGFGCTGGQHRSVYCAESMARKIASHFPAVEVEVNHREQNIHKQISSTQ